MLMLLSPAFAQKKQNNPYVDDKLFHFGFQLGLNFGSFGITDSNLPVYHGDTLHARVSSLLPGFRVGFVSDLRLCKYLNLRFTPGMEFTSRTISYKAKNGQKIIGSIPDKYQDKIDVLSMPIDLPLYLKFSAARESNYRPYVIAGGGVSFNVSRDHEKPILLNLMDYFCQVGFGCDFYFRWFKLCPELTYRIGFADQLCPVSERHDELSPMDTFYSNAIQRMTSHAICLTFNFE